MKIGIITGSGFYDFPDLEAKDTHRIATPYGDVSCQMAERSGHSLYFIPRHEEGHRRLPNVINYRANIRALKESGVQLIIATSVMGVLDRHIELAHLMIFDDLFFPDNRLPDGQVCTMYCEERDPSRGHYLFGRPFSSRGTELAKRAADKAGVPVVDNLIHAHSGGPRFNSKTEILFFKNAGCHTVSQTVGPEIILSGESEIGIILLGFGIDYANGVEETPTPVEVLNKNLEKSKGTFSSVILGIIDTINEDTVFFDNGFVYRFE